MISVWYGTSKSGTNGSPYFWISTFSLSSLPIGTLGSMILGIIIMIFLTFSPSSASNFSSSARRSAFLVTCSFTASASSFLPCAINAPICLEIFFLFDLKSSASCWVALLCASNSITSSTKGSFSSWNLLRMFCFTTSGFSLTNFKSNIINILLFC